MKLSTSHQKEEVALHNWYTVISTSSMCTMYIVERIDPVLGISVYDGIYAFFLQNIVD